VLPVSKTEQVESELRKLSQAELREMREWLDEDSIQRSERDMAAGKAARVHELKGS
jgi:hypothetical protein